MFGHFTTVCMKRVKQKFLFSNLHTWKIEFKCKITWNFFATSHRKGALDGIGSTVQQSF